MDDTKKLKEIALYMDALRKIHTNNAADTKNKEANQHLIASNIKVSDAIMHLDKAFNLIMES